MMKAMSVVLRGNIRRVQAQLEWVNEEKDSTDTNALTDTDETHTSGRGS